jgi:hypothetical protein
MIVHLIDGTYELFRHFYGLRRFNQGKDAPYGAVIGVLRTVLQLVEAGATHVGVATDQVIESFRNRLWDGYKTGAGIEPALWRQFRPLEEALAAMERERRRRLRAVLHRIDHLRLRSVTDARHPGFPVRATRRSYKAFR